MTGTVEILALAVAAFIGGHFVLSSLPVRKGIIARTGEAAFRGIYTLVALGTFAWMLFAFGNAPYVEVWAPAPALRHVPVVVMPFASILVVAGLSTRTPTGVGGETLLDDPHPLRGISTVTRHPFLWGVALWGMAHTAANGDVAGILLFGGMTVLALGGMAHIDHRRRELSGSAWGPVAMGSSVIPFLAAMQGRATIDWSGIGLARVAGGLALYAVLLLIHEFAFGVSVIPW